MFTYLPVAYIKCSIKIISIPLLRLSRHGCDALRTEGGALLLVRGEVFGHSGSFLDKGVVIILDVEELTCFCCCEGKKREKPTTH